MKPGDHPGLARRERGKEGPTSFWARSLSLKSSQTVCRSAAAVALGLLAAALGWAFLRRPPPKTFVDPFTGSPFYESHVVRSEGWTAAPGGLSLAPGASGLRQLQLPKRQGQRILLSLRFRQPQGGMNRVHVGKPDPRGEGPGRAVLWENQDFDFEAKDLGEVLEGAGYFFVTLHAETPPNAVASSEPLITRFAVRYEPAERPFHWGAALFFFLLAVLGYGVFLFVIAPEAWAAAHSIGRAISALRLPWAVLASALALAGVLAVGAHGQWREQKRFDDLAALGSACLLGENGFDLSETFFRARIRPALGAWLQPWASLLRHDLSASTFTPSDRKERMFFFYDRPGWSYGKRLYPEMSPFFALLAVAGLLLCARLGERLGLGALSSAGLFVFGSFFMSRCLYNSLSEAASLTTTTAAAFLAAEAWRRPSRWRIFVAGVVFSFTILLKETFVVLAAAVGAYQIWTWRLKEAPAQGNRWAQFLSFWGLAATLPLVYYGLLLDTGFGEILANHRLIYYAEKYHGYEPLRLASGLRTYWTAFGVGLPLAVIGLARAVRARTRTQADRFFLAWFAGSLWTLTLPFLFARFLVFSIPPFAYLAVRGCEELWALGRLGASWIATSRSQPTKHR